MTPDLIRTPCRRDYMPAYRQSGTRLRSDIRWIVMHDTEGGTAAQVANYFSSVKAGGSTHLVIDDNQCYRCLDDTVIPWGAPGANTNGFHIEQCGFARWTTILWSTTHRRLLRRAAWKAAVHCHKFGIPARFVYAKQLAAGEKGVTTHAEVTKWQGTIGGHTDPGKGWPRRLFMFFVRRYLAELQAQD